LLPQAALRGPRPSTVEHHAKVHGLTRPPLLRAALCGLRLSAVTPRATLRVPLRHTLTNGQTVDRPSARGLHAFHCRAPRLRSERPPPPSAGPPIHLGTRAHCGWPSCLPPLPSRLQPRSALAKITLHWANLSRVLYRPRGLCPPSSERCRAPSGSPRPSSTRPEPSAASPTPLRTSVVPHEEHETAESPSMGFVFPSLPPAFAGASSRTQMQRAPQPRAALTRAPPSAERCAPNRLPYSPLAPSLRGPHRSSAAPEAPGF
jgi:hypothetical protein